MTSFKVKAGLFALVFICGCATTSQSRFKPKPDFSAESDRPSVEVCVEKISGCAVEKNSKIASCIVGSRYAVGLDLPKEANCFEKYDPGNYCFKSAEQEDYCYHATDLPKKSFMSELRGNVAAAIDGDKDVSFDNQGRVAFADYEYRFFNPLNYSIACKLAVIGIRVDFDEKPPKDLYDIRTKNYNLTLPPNQTTRLSGSMEIPLNSDGGIRVGESLWCD